MSFREGLLLCRRMIETYEHGFCLGLLSARGPRIHDISVVSSGVAKINDSIGFGGYPEGCFVEIIGPPDSGKSSMALLAVRDCLALGGRVAYFDLNYALDAGYLASIGIHHNGFLCIHPTTREECFWMFQELIRAQKIDLFVLDAVSTLVTENTNDSFSFARYFFEKRHEKECHRLVEAWKDANTLTLFISQENEPARTLSISSIGSKEQTMNDFFERLLKKHTAIQLTMTLRSKQGKRYCGTPIFRGRVTKNSFGEEGVSFQFEMFPS